MSGIRHLISIDDLTDEDLRAIVARGSQFREAARTTPDSTLAGVMVGIYFRRTSTRTRSAFACGVLRLGGQIITYGPDDLQLITGETIEDTALVLGRMLRVLVARTAGSEEELRAMTNQDRMSVVNAMTAGEHPTQALTDLTTMLCRFGRIEGLRVLYVGEGNSTAAALALALSRFPGVYLELRTPVGYGLAESIRARAEGQAAGCAATVVERHDMADLPAGCDVIYTTRWQTTGSTKPDERWRDGFAPFRVDSTLWRDNPDAVFMHDLPAHRGEEVTGEVLDSPVSIAFDQAENKLHSAMAVLEWCRHGAMDGFPVRVTDGRIAGI